MTTPPAANAGIGGTREADKPVTQPHSGRGRKPGQKAKERQPIPASEMQFERVDREDRQIARRKRGERSEQQLAYDKLAKQQLDEWRELGKPSNWLDMPVIQLILSKQYVDDAQFYLRKGADLYVAKCIFGNITDKDVKNGGRKFPDGKFRIPFAIVERGTEVAGAPEQSA